MNIQQIGLIAFGLGAALLGYAVQGLDLPLDRLVDAPIGHDRTTFYAIAGSLLGCGGAAVAWMFAKRSN